MNLKNSAYNRKLRDAIGKRLIEYGEIKGEGNWEYNTPDYLKFMKIMYILRLRTGITCKVFCEDDYDALTDALNLVLPEKEIA